MKALPVVFRPLAADDLHRIVAYIASDNPEAARKVRLAVVSTIELLATNPAIGFAIRGAPPADSNCRYYPVSGFRNYLIFYQVFAAKLRIVRILHTAQDWTRYFRRH